MEKDERSGSEVARLLGQIQAEYEAGVSALSGLAAGSARHDFITARLEHMSDLHHELRDLIGEQAITMIAQTLDELP